MTKRFKPLTDAEVRTAKPNTNQRDGNGLFLRVNAKGGKSWVFRYTAPAGDMAGRGREMGLGAYPAVSLADARAAATEARSLVNRGADPIAERDAKRVAAVEWAAAKADAPNLGQYADTIFLPDMLKGFANKAHRQQWVATFRTHFAPLRSKKLSDLTKKDVLDTLKPLWAAKYITASRSRERLERLFDHAAQNHAFEGQNPAEMRHFSAVLVRPKAMAKGHHAAIPHPEVAAFIQALRRRQEDSLAALMVEFIALTAARTGEARFMTWGEIDLGKSIWTIPAARMKMRRSHIVPLTPRAVEILVQAKDRHPATQTQEGVQPDDFVFSSSGGKALSEMSGLMLLRRMKGYEGFTVHGLRATFKSWAMAETEFARELIEESLAHALGAVEAAYARVSAVERRRAVMTAWASYLDGTAPAGATVLSFKAVGASE
jgi:integrase